MPNDEWGDSAQPMPAWLEQAARALDAAAQGARAPTDLADAALRVAAELLQVASESARPSEDGPASQRLQVVALADISSIAAIMATATRCLANAEGFDALVKLKGHQVEHMMSYLSLTSDLYECLARLVSLMQFDEERKVPVDLNQGFLITSGSNGFGRSPFFRKERKDG